MRTLYFSFITLTFLAITQAFGQTKRTFDPTNAREGEKVEYCHQHIKMAELLANPEFAAMYEQDKIAFEKAKNKAVPKGIVYKIPIVFHVLHNNGIENISDEQIYDALAILNRDFRKQNADTANVHPDFAGMPSDVEVEFVLATKAPNGTCFKGITRTISPLSYDGSDGNAQVTAIRNGNDVYQNSWPGNKYLNVFICGDIGGAAGYTTNPASWSSTQMTNGIWILHDYVGSIGTGSINGSRALTHEVGHWLNLDHTWGPNNNPGNASSCSTDDDVEDTPNCIGVTACLLNANTCSELVYELNYNQDLTSSNGNVRINVPHSLNQGDSIFISQIDGGIANPSLEGTHTIISIGNGYLVINLPWTNISNSTIDGTIVRIPYWNYDVRDNVENYMDYSYCSKMYTPGQVARMRAALQVSTTGRFNLWQAANLTATGATNDFYLCKAQFTTDRTTICLGDSIQLLDDSYNAVTAWNWEITPASGWSFGVGSTATSQNPKVNFSAPGLYTVKLTATDGSTSDDEIKSNYIRVLPDAAVLPYWEGFEYYTTLVNNNYWEVSNPNNNNAWTIESTTAHSGLKCAKITNFGQAAGSIDELTSAPIDLSVVPSTGSVTLSFRYAYRKKTSADYEYLKVFASSNCGETWAQRKTLGGNSLSSLTSSTSWMPTQQSEWVTVHMTNITNSYFTPNFKMRFRFEGEGGNNIYLDDINLYSGAPSDNLVLGVNEISELKDIELFPNPTEGDIHLRYFSEVDVKVNVSITDISGKEVNKTTILSKSGNNLIVLPTEGLSSGTYFIKLGNSSQTLKFVVK